MKIACVLADGFEDLEFTKPFEALCEEGYAVTVIGVKRNEELVGKRGKVTVTTSRGIDEVKPEDFDALLIPGGHSPDKLRSNEDIVAFVQRFYDLGRPIMAICHGPQLLMAANRYKGYPLTAWQTIQEDLAKAGAEVVDQEVVSDGQVITSRNPDDLPAFIDASLSTLSHIPA